MEGLSSGLQRAREADRRLLKLTRKLGGVPGDVVILANGGYGRCDITPGSDLDVLVLLTGEDRAEFVRSFVQGLWDQNLHPGHTVLHLNDIDQELIVTPDRAAALLEARVVCGDEHAVVAIEKRVNSLMNGQIFRKYVHAKDQEYYQRREKYGLVARIVEPHLKSQAGGLRDMQYVLWIDRARTAKKGSWVLPRTAVVGVTGLIASLRRRQHLNRNEARQLVDAYSMLLTLRELLRNRTGREEDILSVAHQVPIGREFGHAGSDRQVMHALMHDTYLALEKIARFADEFGPLLAEEERRKKPRPVPKWPGLSIRGNRLELEDEVIQQASLSPEHLLALIDKAEQLGVAFAGRDRHRLRRALEPLRQGVKPDNSWVPPLLKWFALKNGFASRLRRLDELDAISIWLPEWREIVALTTGSYYHSYSVDEHTLRALERLDDLPGDMTEGLPATLWDSCEQRPLVYFSLLLHDIAKGREGDHWRIGEEMARDALIRLDLEKWAGEVARLVRLHLRMEQVAFRRDSKDPAVLAEFAEEVGDQQTLDALYLITVCDLSAVSDRVWTEWKGRLLAELYLETREWFTRGKRAVPATAEEEASRVAPLLDGDENRAWSFLASMRDEYLRVVPAEEIALHVRAVEELRAGQPYRWIIERRDGYILLTLITWDRVGLLADIAGLLVTQGIGIREARIFTREDRVVIDRFRAEDIQPGGIPLQERLDRIPQLWGQLIENSITLDDLFNRFRRSRRLDKPRVAMVESEINITPRPDGFIVDVSGPDSVGLLYRLCRVYADAGLDVRAARVSRRIDGIVDAFLLHDPNGRIQAQMERLKLIQSLHEVLETKE